MFPPLERGFTVTLRPRTVKWLPQDTEATPRTEARRPISTSGPGRTVLWVWATTVPALTFKEGSRLGQNHTAKGGLGSVSQLSSLRALAWLLLKQLCKLLGHLGWPREYHGTRDHFRVIVTFPSSGWKIPSGRIISGGRNQGLGMAYSLPSPTLLALAVCRPNTPGQRWQGNLDGPLTGPQENERLRD